MSGWVSSFFFLFSSKTKIVSNFLVHPILILTVDSNSSKNRKEAFYIMDGWTDGHIYGQTERSEIFFL
jgi:hypothetical protein